MKRKEILEMFEDRGDSINGIVDEITRRIKLLESNTISLQNALDKRGARIVELEKEIVTLKENLMTMRGQLELWTGPDGRRVMWTEKEVKAIRAEVRLLSSKIGSPI